MDINKLEYTKENKIMWYVGSKNKLSKDLVPIIQSYITSDTKGYLEPFVGGEYN